MFEGFSQETQAFFVALSCNNNRDFFASQRALFERAVKKPLLDLADALAPVVAKIDPQLDTRPGKVISRIHRDIRFRKDKTPYKTSMWLGWRRLGEGRMDTCGFYFDISASEANWGAGFYHAQPETMAVIRRRLREHPAEARKVFEDKRLRARFTLEGDAYVRQHRPPDGMRPALAAVYPKKCVYAEHNVTDLAAVYAPSVVQEIAEDFRTLAPLYAFLRQSTVRAMEGVEG